MPSLVHVSGMCTRTSLNLPSATKWIKLRSLVKTFFAGKKPSEFENIAIRRLMATLLCVQANVLPKFLHKGTYQI